MRHFGISLAILGLLSAVVFLCLRFAVRIEGHELAELSMLPFVAFGHVSGVIEQRMARKEIMEHGGRTQDITIQKLY